MLAIRMQRTGRKGHAQYRVIVQESRRTPTSGRIVAQLGSYDPHSKATTLNKEKASFYLEHGAQPSPRIVKLLQSEGLKLPTWVIAEADKKRTIRHTDKLRRNRPSETAESANAAEPAKNDEPAKKDLVEAEPSKAEVDKATKPASSTESAA